MSDNPFVAAIEKIAKTRGCIGPYPCGKGIPEFGGRDVPCLCQALVEAGADALASRMVNPSFGPTHHELKVRSYDRAADVLEATLPILLDAENITEPLDPETAKFAAALLDLDGCIANLPEAEREEYRRCKQSVIDARASAWRNEGQRVIG